MRSFRTITLLTALAASAAAPQAALGRHFWQTYGATVASPDGGCAWNLNSDYFVPRQCGSGTYDLFSSCKQHHYRSPACRSLHPVYCGYCTPYGACHYKWRDHVYKEHCGCAPLACHYGPWDLEKCRKHGCGAGHGCGGELCTSSSCASGMAMSASPLPCVGGYATQFDFAPHDGGYLPNVEPLGGQTLGTIAAASVRMPMGGGGMMAGGMTSGGAMPGAMGMPQGQTLPPPMGLLPGTSGSSTGFSSPFGTGP